jgi:hypothetical protein
VNATEAATAKLAISEVVAKYGHYADHPGYDGMLDLFTDDAVFDASSVFGTSMTGKAEIRTFFEGSADAVAHHPTSMFTEFLADGSARTVCKMLVFFTRQVFSVDYDWEFVPDGGSWLIRRQTISVIGKVRLAESARA